MNRFLHIILLLLLACLLSACGHTAVVTKAELVPEPVFYVQKEGSFTIGNAPRIATVGLGQNSPTMRTIMQSIRQAHMRPRLVPATSNSDIELRINDTLNSELGSEGYLLEVRSNGISLSANTEQGIFYGFQTLIQLLPPEVSEASYRSVVLPECTILDYPRFPVRAMRLDLSHLAPSVKQFKRWLDIASSYKINTLLLQSDSACPPYTAQELADLQAYAADHCMLLSLADTLPFSPTLILHDDIRQAHAAARAGHRVLLYEEDYCDFSRYQADPRYHPFATAGMLTLSKVYAFDPAPIGTNSHVEANIAGALCHLDSECLSSVRDAEFMLLPRLLAFSEVMWTPLKRRDWMRFRHHNESHKERLDARGYHYCEGSFTPLFEARRVDAQTMNISITTEVPNTYIFYTLDLSEPTRTSSIYLGPINLRRGTHIKILPVYKNQVRDSVYEYVIK